MKMICENCRWWQRNKVDSERECFNVDSDVRFTQTDADYSCNHWEQALEQDGNATWYIE